MDLRKALSSLMVMGAVTTAHADVCKFIPGNVTCGKGTVNQLSGNGMVTVSGTTVEGVTQVNGMLNADDARFASLNVNGSANLTQCTIQQDAEIKGALKASSSTFEKSLTIFSNLTRLTSSKVNAGMQIHHTDNPNQEVYLDSRSEVLGDIVFDDGHGKVFVSSDSKVHGNVIGGTIINK